MVWSFTTRTNKQLDLMHTGLFPLSSKLVNFLKRFLQVFFFFYLMQWPYLQTWSYHFLTQNSWTLSLAPSPFFPKVT